MPVFDLHVDCCDIAEMEVRQALGGQRSACTDSALNHDLLILIEFVRISDVGPDPKFD